MMHPSPKFLLCVGSSSNSLFASLNEVFKQEIIFFNTLADLKPWLFLRVLKNEILPTGIIADIPYSEKEINTFYDIKSFQQIFFSIPFILYSSEILDLNQKKHWVSNKFIDDIFDGPVNIIKLKNRIQFLSDYKIKLKEYKPLDDELEVGLNDDKIGQLLKRTFDILVSGLILLISSPIFLIVAIIIKLESKGPIFYKSNRAGSNYKIFQFLKFRTMYVGSDSRLKEMLHLNQYGSENDNSHIFVKIASDPRITKFGSFLRNTSLDEIPQLFNVLKGDMSLVGNRPLPLYEAVSLTKDEWIERFLAPAGITGLWQITKRGQKEMTVGERINLDINYANKNSFIYDLWILVKTPRALIQKENV